MRTKPSILVVDDEDHNRRLLETLLKAEGYAVTLAGGGEEALAAAAASPPDLVLLDIMMPGMDGFEVARRLKIDEGTRNVPLVMVTALDDRDSRLNALQAGAEEFLSKPVDRVELRVRVRNLLRLKEYSDFLADYNRILETQVKERTAQLRDSHRDTIITLTRAAEYKDEDTGAHIQRVSFYAAELAERLGLSEEFSDTIFYASPMHDVGKIGIPDHVLLKPGPLSAEEWGIIKSHCAFGAQILKNSTSPYGKMGAEIALSHHERWDGSGYPNGLSGEDIPLSGRIMSVCDVYDALRSKRPYKPAFDHDRAVAVICEGDGRTRPEHFDPAVLGAFCQSTGRFAEIFSAYSE